MQQQTPTQVVDKLLDRKDKKSLGSTLIYVYDRWVEEQHYEDFDCYAKFIKNGLRKVTPKRTKFIGFTKGLNRYGNVELTLTIKLADYEQNTKIVTNKRGLNYTFVPANQTVLL